MWILVEKVTDISAARLLTLSATPIEIIPDPGANKENIPVSIAWDFLPGDTPYNAAGSLVTVYGGGAAAPYTTFVPSLNAAVQKTGYASAPGRTTADASTCTGAITAFLAAPATGGNGSLRITSKYYVHELQTA